MGVKWSVEIKAQKFVFQPIATNIARAAKERKIKLNSWLPCEKSAKRKCRIREKKQK